MNILVTNDDGINSEALKQLVKALSTIGDVFVVAPDSERSGNSQHITSRGRIRIEERQMEGAKKAYALWGTPTDCIHVSLKFLLRDQIDLVVSGINIGPNQSSDICYSGTCGAAREAFMLKVPSIAISTCSWDSTLKDFSVCTDTVLDVIPKYMANPDRSKYFLNINVPFLKAEEIKGYKVATTDAIVYYKDAYEWQEEYGVKYINMHFTFDRYGIEEENINNDICATNAGYISITPVDCNSLCREYYEKVKQEWEK